MLGARSGRAMARLAGRLRTGRRSRWMLGRMSALTAVAMLAAASGATCNVVPEEIIAALTAEPPRDVVARLWDGGRCEEALLEGLGSGDPEWIALALALRPYTDAWSSESTQVMLGFAMLRAPSRILPLVGQYGFGDSICFPWDFEDSEEGLRLTQRRIASAIPMFESFLNTNLEPQARQCLESLQTAIARNPDLRPNRSQEPERE